MQFATAQFAAFFLPVLAVAWACRPWPTARKAFLLVASYAFYAGWDWRLLTLIVGMSVVNWLAGEFIATATDAGVRRTWLGISLAVDLGVLGWFKYYGFFRDNVEVLAQALGVTSGLPVLEVLLPLGISYITFQCMTYTIDLHRGYGVRAGSLLDFLLFIAFFPQVLIGPICRSRDLLPQLEGPVPDGIPDLSHAVGRIASGLFKKVVLSSYLATHLVEDAFNAPERFSSVELLVAAYAYTIQIYCDFSGYTDMAIGIALLLGVYLPDNFDHPYRATNIAEFWRRWHITFSNWLRDYVFLPSGGSWGSKPRTYFNLMVVMWVTGIWHGAAWKFMVWGSIHGVALVAYKAVQDWRKARGVRKGEASFSRGYVFLAWLYTFHLVVFARIFFRSTDVEVALTYCKQLLSFTVFGRGLEWLVLPVVAFGLALNFWGPRMRTAFEDLHTATPGPLKPAIWLAVGVIVLALQPADVAPFIYFQF